MIRILVVALLSTFSLTGYTFEKCTDADGRVYYGDFCTVKEPVEVKSLNIRNTNVIDSTTYSKNIAPQQVGRPAIEYIDAAARLTRNLPYGTPESKIMREILLTRSRITLSIGEAKMSGIVTPEADALFEKALRQLSKLPYGTSGDKFKRESMYANARQFINMGRVAMGLNIDKLAELAEIEKTKERMADLVEHRRYWQQQEQLKNQEYKYKSYTGQRYKYDLSRQEDRTKYAMDPAAQLKDGVSSMRNLDRGMGQNGGGIQ